MCKKQIRTNKWATFTTHLFDVGAKKRGLEPMTSGLWWSFRRFKFLTVQKMHIWDIDDNKREVCEWKACTCVSFEPPLLQLWLWQTGSGERGSVFCTLKCKWSNCCLWSWNSKPCSVSVLRTSSWSIFVSVRQCTPPKWVASWVHLRFSALLKGTSALL